MQVIKVKKEKKEWKPGNCPCCGKKIEEKKGNFVNGENLDKIKFPCYCEFEFGEHKYYGEINKGWDNLAYIYLMTKLTEQTGGSSIFLTSSHLKDMFIQYKIKILKGKVIIFKEEK